MSFELQCLAWTLVLALVQIFAAAGARTVEYGVKWDLGARDSEPRPLGPVAARLLRAQANLFETLPLFVAAVLLVSVAQRTGPLTYWGALIYLIARVVYVPLYAAGVAVLRTLVWLISLVGLLMLIVAAL
ncbi:MAPEG family protein [Niveibacterium sp. SC-1]|uniref:MAPEG family protein n=1 Tax=Niveibacterium sp. SC-1 TaxID=3135646 RepID=UPI00311F1BEB